jgi:hypothetical protein
MIKPALPMKARRGISTAMGAFLLMEGLGSSPGLERQAPG